MLVFQTFRLAAKMPPPPQKKLKIGKSEIAKTIEDGRKQVAESVEDFQFNTKRVRLLTGNEGYLHREVKAVAYWMHRDQRLQDNWAALFAQKLAMADHLPLHVVAGISVTHPKSPEATRRMIDFSLGGLQEVQEECSKLGIEFHLLGGNGEPMSKRILDWMKKAKVGCVVADFSPLKPHRGQLELLKEGMTKLNGPCLYQVDAHNIVPIWESSDKQEYAARTIRPKIMNRLNEFLKDFPPVVKHPVKTNHPAAKINWDVVKKEQNVDEAVGSVDWARPGTSNGLDMLESFVKTRLKLYGEKRNDPNVDALSNLSPWTHYGQLGVQRAVLYVKKNASSSHKDSVAAFVEEAVVRSELSDNFCYYQVSIPFSHFWATQVFLIFFVK